MEKRKFSLFFIMDPVEPTMKKDPDPLCDTVGNV